MSASVASLLGLVLSLGLNTVYLFFLSLTVNSPVFGVPWCTDIVNGFAVTHPSISADIFPCPNITVNFLKPLSYEDST